MINSKYKLLISGILLFVSSLSSADVSKETINELLDLSGLTAQVNQFPDLIKQGMDQARQEGNTIPVTEYSSIVNSIDVSIVPSEILEEIGVSLKNSIHELEAQKLLAWYRSDLGKEITRAEENASSPEAFQEMMKNAQSLMANTERVDFANRLDLLLGATDMTMDIQKFSGIAVYSAIMTTMEPEKPLNIEPIAAQMDALNEQSRAAIKQMIIISFVYSYKDIGMDDLKKYETFLNDATTIKFNNIIINSMNKGLETSVSNWAAKLAQVFKTNQ